MKLILLSFLFLLSTFQLIEQFDFDGLLRKNQIDSANFKNRGIYVTYSPVCIGNSINTDNKDRFSNISSRVAIHWMTKRYQKFQLFTSFGSAYNRNSYRVKTFETGLMIWKVMER